MHLTLFNQVQVDVHVDFCYLSVNGVEDLSVRISCSNWIEKLSHFHSILAQWINVLHMQFLDISVKVRQSGKSGGSREGGEERHRWGWDMWFHNP